jgi:hypothetical protein
MQATMSGKPSNMFRGSSTPDKSGLFRELILESLRYSSMNDRQEEVAEAHQKTFDWIFQEKSNFSSWLKDAAQDIYWVNGKAGSGKSTLMRLIYDHKFTKQHLSTWAGDKPLVMAGFFFWTSGSLEQRSQAGLLRSLLYQLLSEYRTEIAATFPDLWLRLSKISPQERIKNPIPWSLPELMDGLDRFLERVSSEAKVCLLIDGLDEFDGDHQQIINFFTSLSVNYEIKACLSSRPWPVFEEAFRSMPTLKLQDLTLSDMTQYVEDKFNMDPRSRRIIRKEPEAGRQLTAQIVHRADGVFLWVTLVVRSLLDAIKSHEKVSDIQERLEDLPTDLDTLFRRLLIDSSSEVAISEASRFFQLVRARESVCEFTRDQSSASMTIWEFALARNTTRDLLMTSDIRQVTEEELGLQCRETEKHIITKCAGLLEVHDKRGRNQKTGLRFTNEASGENAIFAQSKVTYLHRTVRDYLMEPTTWSLLLGYTSSPVFDPHLAHLQSYIMGLKLPTDPPEKHRRLDEWWSTIVLVLTHARLLSPLSVAVQTDLLDLFESTLSWYWNSHSSDPLDNWARAAFNSYEERTKTVFHDPFLSLATKFGITHYIDTKLSSGNVSYKDGQPLLSYAIEFLFNRKKSVYPLSSPELVATILRHGGDPNVVYKDFHKRKETPWLRVLKAMREAHRRGWIEESEEERGGVDRWAQIVKMFVEHGADPDIVIDKTIWDPAITAFGVLQLIADEYGFDEMEEIKCMVLAKRGLPDGTRGAELSLGAISLADN